MTSESNMRPTRHARSFGCLVVTATMLIGLWAGETARGATPPQGADATIAVDMHERDFGTVWGGPDLHHTFKVTNNGDRTMEILHVRPGCGCTLAGDYKKRLQPGETGDFPFTLKTEKLTGRFRKTIAVTTNVPGYESIQFALSGTVKRYIDVEPDQVFFGRLTGNKPLTKTVTFTNNTDKPLELNLAEVPDNDNFAYNLEATEPGRSFTLTVTATPPFVPGRVQDIVKLSTNIEQQKDMSLRVLATVPNRLDVSPAKLMVPRARSGGSSKPLVRWIRFTNNGDGPVHLLEAFSDAPEHIKVSIDPKVEGKDYSIVVEVAAGYQPPEADNMITLRTDDTQQPTLTIPVSAAQSHVAKRQMKPAERLVGTEAPPFEVTTTGGNKVTKASIGGKIAVLDFFAPNCPHCKRQLPVIDKIRKQYETKGVEFLYLSQTMRGKFFEDAKVVEFMTEMKVDGPLATDPGNRVGPLFNATSFPTLVVIGKTGNVEAANVGNIHDLDARLRAQLDALIAGEPIPTFKSKPQQLPKRKRRPAMDLIGGPAPSFSLTTLDGQTISIEKIKEHKATVLNLVAANCGFCKRQVPDVEKIRQEYAAKGILFVNIVEKMRKEFTAEDVATIFGDLGARLPIVHDPANTMGGKFKAVSFPTLFLLDRNGKVHDVIIGARRDLEQTVRKHLDALIAGPSTAKPLPAEE